MAANTTPSHLRGWTTIDDSELEQLRHCRSLLEIIGHEFEQVITAHDPTDPRHRSHGGQHTNGPCCPFGNVNPSSLREFRWLSDAIKVALK